MRVEKEPIFYTMVQHKMAALMSHSESLSIGVVTSVNCDVLRRTFAYEHPGDVVIERLEVQLGAERLSDPIHKDRDCGFARAREDVKSFE